ncbi:MAG: hypothetical protein V7750_04060 [Sneathiella sp.]
MSGIKSTSGASAPNVDSFKGASSTRGEIAPASSSSPSGGQSGPAVPQASSISALSEGARIPAIVTARAKGGDTMLHAEIGNFRMSANSQLPVGSYVVLEVEAFDDVITARIISINGEKLASPPSVTLLPTISPPALPDKGYVAPNKVPSPDVQVGLQNLTAALAKISLPTPSGSEKNTGSIFANLQPTLPAPAEASIGNRFFPATLNIQDSSLSKIGPSQSAGTAAYAHTHSPGPKPSLTPLMQNSVTDIGATKLILPDISDNSRLLVKAVIQQPPLKQSIEFPSGTVKLNVGTSMAAIISSSTNPLEKTSNSVTTNGTVFAVTRPNRLGMTPQIHVQTASAGTLTYSAASTPQVGTRLNVTLLENMQQFPLPAPLPPSSIFKLSHIPVMNNWENLGSALNLIAAQNPDLARSILNSRIPSANTQLGSSLLFLLSALNVGNMDKWLGQDFRKALETMGNKDLLLKLDDDFSILAKANSEPGGQDWKALAFPFFDGEALRQLKLFYRRRESEEGEKEDDSTRFVIELDLSKTGPVQLDGLFHKSRFDLVFRTQMDVAEELRQQVLKIFNSNLEITGIHGSLVFKRTIPFPVHPSEEWENNMGDIFNA